MKEKIKKISENIYEIPKEGKMNVKGIVFASEKLFKSISKDKTLEQVRNIASLPGIVEKSIAMPDAHQGYGASIGGVAAFDIKKGIISPGAIGYDLNCGVRLLATNLSKKDFINKKEKVLNDLFKEIPSGVGRGTDIKFTDKDLDQVLTNGSQHIVKMGFGTKDDLEKTENNGKIENANSKLISQKAKARGRNQLGTIGAGNHFVEIQEVSEVLNDEVAKVFGLKESQIVLMIHTGSRGLGHQTASDYILKMEKEYGFEHLPDRELASAPIKSELGKEYLSAMAAAANFAFANRQLITHKIRETFTKHFPNSKTMVVYDVAHNIAKFEKFKINGKIQELCVHRKGATRSFGPGRKELPKIYQKTGQPILIPGSMGTSSYVLVGTKKAEEISFASTAHGAGRQLSRTEAKKQFPYEKIKKDLEQKNIFLKSASMKGASEEAPGAYKDVDEVVKVSDELGIGKLVAKLKPLAVMKG